MNMRNEMYQKHKMFYLLDSGVLILLAITILVFYLLFGTQVSVPIDFPFSFLFDMDLFTFTPYQIMTTYSVGWYLALAANIFGWIAVLTKNNIVYSLAIIIEIFAHIILIYLAYVAISRDFFLTILLSVKLPGNFSLLLPVILWIFIRIAIRAFVYSRNFNSIREKY